MITLNHYGWHKELNIFLFGDCLITQDGLFHFPVPDCSHFLINGDEIYVSEKLEFFHAPLMFPGCEYSEQAAAKYLEIDWDEEARAVREIFLELLSDFSILFSGGGSEAIIAGFLSYLAHPEIFNNFGGKPGLWIQGPKATGKTESIRLAMNLLGFSKSSFVTPDKASSAGAERTLTKYWDLPVHFDEWRNKRISSSIENLIRCAYNEVTITKVTSEADSKTIPVTPSTIPIITGEDSSCDAALRSRFIIVVSAPVSGISEHLRIMHQRAQKYHRIARYLLTRRAGFAMIAISASRDAYKYFEQPYQIADKRSRDNSAIFVGVLTATLVILKCIRSDDTSHESIIRLVQLLAKIHQTAE